MLERINLGVGNAAPVIAPQSAPHESDLEDFFENGAVALHIVAPDGAGPKLRLKWRESGGPEVAPPVRRGFGSLLVERGIQAELGGASKLEFAPAGVRCDIELPLAGGM